MDKIIECKNMLKELTPNELIVVAALGAAVTITQRISQLNIDITESSIKASVSFS